MLHWLQYTLAFALFFLVLVQSSPEIRWYSTTRDLKFTLTPREALHFDASLDNSAEVEKKILVNEETKYQTIYGIGSSLESSTCYNLMRMSEDDRSDTLKKLLDPVNGIGMSLMRVTVGTSDFCPLPFYSYDDSEEPDEDLSNFSIEKDQDFILPILRDAAKLYTAGPDGLRFFASTWSPPAWMKTSAKLEGGRYHTSYFPQYAQYLLKYVMAYKSEGIDITALTPQNEPLQNEDTYPTTLLLPQEEAELIKDHLGPLFSDPQNNCSTSIWCFDHNFNTLFYPKTVLKDPEAAEFVSGTAFHNYGGQPSAMTELHNEFPDKNIFFSEGSTFGVRGAAQIVAILRNWATTYNAWVTILDSDLQPNAGPFKPAPTMIELDTATLKPKYKFEYYMYGHFSKFVRRGAVRVETTSDDNAEEDHDRFAHVGFVGDSDSGEKRVLVVVNGQQSEVKVQIEWKGLVADVVVPPDSVNTFEWDNQ